MLTLKDLEKRLGLGEWQVRRLFEAVRPVLEQRGLVQGSRGKALKFSSEAIPMFERAKVLNERGVALKELQSTLEGELDDSCESATDADSTPAPNSAEFAQTLLVELRDRIQEYQRREERWEAERQRLLAMLEDRDEQLRALLPGPPQGSTPTPTGNGGRERMSRWHAFKYALLGR